MSITLTELNAKSKGTGPAKKKNTAKLPDSALSLFGQRNRLFQKAKRGDKAAAAAMAAIAPLTDREKAQIG